MLIQPSVNADKNQNTAPTSGDSMGAGGCRGGAGSHKAHQQGLFSPGGAGRGTMEAHQQGLSFPGDARSASDEAMTRPDNRESLWVRGAQRRSNDTTYQEGEIAGARSEATKQ